MTDDDKALVERLEEWEWTLRAVYKAGDLGTDEPAIVMGDASSRIEALSAENEQWRACARYDATMEGPVFKGWDRSALERCRRAALGDTK